MALLGHRSTEELLAWLYESYNMGLSQERTIVTHNLHDINVLLLYSYHNNIILSLTVLHIRQL